MTVGHLAIPDRTLADFCRRWKLRELSVFGSVLRDDFTADSDVDVLVSFEPDAAWSLFDIVNMRAGAVGFARPAGGPRRGSRIAESVPTRGDPGIEAPAVCGLKNATPRTCGTCSTRPGRSRVSSPASRAEDYARNRQLQYAVERALEIIGEAARRVSDSIAGAHPEIPWPQIIGQRNVLAHEYGEIKHERIWLVATRTSPS